MKTVDELPALRFSPSLREGMAHHAGGRLPEAAECYLRAYKENPGDADAPLLLGIVARQAKRFPAAIQLTTLAAERRPEAAHVHLNLALAYLGAGDAHRAALCCRKSLARDPRSERAWCCLGEIEESRGNFLSARAAFRRGMNLPSSSGRAALGLGNLLSRQEHYAEAVTAYNLGIRRAPANAQLHFALGAALGLLEKPREAQTAYRKALSLQPQFPEAHLSLGNALYQQGDFLAAAASYRCALAQRPGYVKAYCNLGNTLSALERYEEATACYERALAVRPDALAAQHNFGNTLLRLRDYRRAEECFRRALQLDPLRAEYHNSLGNALLQQHRAAEAETCYRRALTLAPDYSAAHTNLANVLLALGRPREMERHYRRAVELDPESPGGQYNLALCCLRHGNFHEGWRRHEWRWDFRELRLRRRNLPCPQWTGADLAGAPILLHAEQGLGDTFQFVRYLPLVAARGGRVILEVQPRLKPLLQNMTGACQVITRGEPLPELACHCPLMSLPRIFDTGIETIPTRIPYLHADAAATGAAWRESPRVGKQLRVGLVWAGNGKHRADHQRSTSLLALLPLAEVREAAFFSLQFGPAAAQIHPLRQRFPLIDACSQHRDFAQTAALAATLDLIISVDTAVAHLAGAMGLPVWILLSHLADWRWLEMREDSPWYPSARLFRQPAPGAWQPLILRVRDELQTFARGSSLAPHPGAGA
jgi:tetratricopeptide (TPR) repeat protein